MGDLNIFNDPKTIEYLNENIIFVGLNISRGSIKVPFANFHDANPRATDFKTRYALKDTSYWGGYMTDIIKNYSEVDSGQIPKYLKDNPDIEANNVKVFEEELDDLGSKNPLIIAFGALTFKILQRNFKHRYKIKKIPHYANHGSKERYREDVIKILNT